MGDRFLHIFPESKEKGVIHKTFVSLPNFFSHSSLSPLRHRISSHSTGKKLQSLFMYTANHEKQNLMAWLLMDLTSEFYHFQFHLQDTLFCTGKS